MPHFHIDYSPNLEGRLDIAQLCRVIAETARETELFPAAGIRVRATACTHVYMADGDPKHAFIDMSVRLRAGRPAEAKVAATETIFAAMQGYCQQLLDSGSLMLSMEMRDIDPDLSPKTSSIRKYLPEDMR
ncbi:5-carboxymethyl-2-hydroxymuconate isomerase [Seohaeicola zhoushanensis]|uniref:5-carboxymethyl-2-hydroxymuconate isomerase n=1 Tax=Seohaeicola zhoushanensis TaxID=1569283 RepID=A0A8J3H382_9RHOB|nr:5-carboxymethyl-2-hydroxymuconate isomerase [Seohaeicola zhoushanensis]GHF72250.1 5-carboxymethyl-2-hydroxymuconate isomerase [Seohaeicola zhoushanensis]